MTVPGEIKTTAARRRKRRRWATFALLLASWVPLVAVVVVVRPSVLPGVLRAVGLVDPRWSIALAGAALVYTGAMIFLSYRHQKRHFAERLETAKEHDGLACPCCATPRTLEAGEPRCCWRMPIGWDRERYEGYWSLVTTNPQAAGAYLMQHVPRSNRITMVFMVMGMSAPMLFMQLIGPLRSLSTLALSLPLFAVALIGAYIAMSSMMHFQAIEPLCAACRYPKRNDSTRCPECGHEWSARIGGTILGKRETNRLRVAIGMLIAMPAFLAFVGAPFWLNPLLLRMSSSTSLIALSTSDNVVERMRVWQELNRRTLAPAEESALAAHLLASRTSTLVDPSAQIFLGGYFAGRTPTPAQRREAIVGAAVPQLVAPERVRRGEEFEVSLEVTTRTEALPIGQLTCVIVHEVWFEDEPQVSWRPAHKIPQAARMYDPQYNRAPLPHIGVRSDRSGERTLVMRVWYVGGLPTLPSTVTWAADPETGTERPVVPAGAFGPELVEVRRRVMVEP